MQNMPGEPIGAPRIGGDRQSQRANNEATRRRNALEELQPCRRVVVADHRPGAPRRPAPTRRVCLIVQGDPPKLSTAPSGSGNFV